MTDPFALFDEPRRPWVDSDQLKAKFLALSAMAHPDRMHDAPENEKCAANDKYAELNAAYLQLREPKERLQVLLELERGRALDPVRPVDSAYVSLFGEVSQICRAADALLTEESSRTSPLLKVRFFQHSTELVERLKRLQGRLDCIRQDLDGDLQELNILWVSAPPIGSLQRMDALPCDRLERIYDDFSYLRRWTNQIRDRILRLSLHLNNSLQ